MTDLCPATGKGHFIHYDPARGATSKGVCRCGFECIGQNSGAAQYPGRFVKKGQWRQRDLGDLETMGYGGIPGTLSLADAARQVRP